MDANPSTNSWCAWWGMGSEGGCSPPKNAPCWLEDENTELSLSLDCIDVSARFCFLTGERERAFLHGAVVNALIFGIGEAEINYKKVNKKT